VGGEFKDCLRTYETSTSLNSNGTTLMINRTHWWAHNIGPIKVNETSYLSHPVEDTGIMVNFTIKLISATVDGVHYGFPAILGGSP